MQEKNSDKWNIRYVEHFLRSPRGYTYREYTVFRNSLFYIPIKMKRSSPFSRTWSKPPTTHHSTITNDHKIADLQLKLHRKFTNDQRRGGGSGMVGKGVIICFVIAVACKIFEIVHRVNTLMENMKKLP